MEAAANVLVGREVELASLADWLAHSDAFPGTFVLEGEAGIGKTTLWRRGVELAAEAPYHVVSCSPSELEGRLSFAAIGDLLEPVLAEVATELPDPQRRALAVALLLEDGEGPPPDSRAVALAFLGAIRVLSSDGPLVVAIDDIQWLDEPSAFAVEFMLRRLRDEPVAFLCGLRRGNLRPMVALDRAVPADRLQHVLLGPLSFGAVHRLVSDRLDLTLSRPKLRRLHELSGGNPFFALELGRAAGRDELVLEPGEPLPLPLSALVRERIEALPSESQVALHAVAALSKPTPMLVGSVIGGDPMTVLAPALDAHVIELRDGRIRFTHPLLASGVSAAMDAGERSVLHRRLAAIVVDVDEQARHLALGTQIPDRGVADALEAAAERAHAKGAMAAATELSEHAQRLTPTDQVEERHRRTIQAASYAFEAGESDRTRALLEEVFAAAPSGRWRAEALGWLARVHEYEGDRRVAVELYRKALAEAGDDLALCSALEDGIAVALFLMREDLVAAADHASAAVDLADRIGDESAKMVALGNLGLIETVLGRPEGRATLEGAVDLERSLEPGGGVGGARLAASPSVLYASALTWTDEFEGARTIFTTARDHAYDRAEESSLPWIQVYLGLIEFLAGRWHEAEQHVREGIEIAVQTRQEPQRLSALGVRSLIGACRGEAEDARADADTVLTGADAYGAMLARIIGSTAVGLLELSLDRPEEAHQVLGPLGDRLESGGVREPGSTPFVPDDIEALIRLGRLDEAEELLDRLERRARRLHRRSVLAAAGRCRGLALAERGDLPAALEVLERATADHLRLPMPFEQARTLLALGVTRRRAKMKHAAREALEESLAAFEQLGAPLWADKARAELARIGGRRPSTGGLTPTERRIAELVAVGRTDKEIAAAVFVTSKTVGTQLSRIYRKVGVRSRTELAAWLNSDAEASKE